MSHLQACRICLAYHSRMFSILNGPLQELYEKITDSLLEMKDLRPVNLCYICYYMLGRFQKFKEKSIKANQLLSHLISSDLEMTVDSLSLIVKQQPDLRWNMTMAPIQNLTHSRSDEELKRICLIDALKFEIEDDETKYQNETVSDDIDYEPALDTNNDKLTDSEVDLPLQNARKSVNKNVSIKNKPKVKTKRNKNTKESKSRDKRATLHKKRKIDIDTQTGTKAKIREVTTRSDEGKEDVLQMKTCERPYSCDYCTKCFTLKSGLIRHVRTHTKDKPYVCLYCNKSFTQNSTLVAHKRIHTNERPYSCDYCSKSFTVKTNLISHRRTHTKEKPYVCDFCNKSFSRNSSLIVHKRIHTNERPYSCDFCSRSFITKRKLIIHLRTHTKEKPYVCDFCNKSFTQRSSLVVHKRIHTNKRPYVCDFCNKSFIQRSHMVRHERIHTGIK